jgi:predicted DNA binding protein
MKKQGSILIEVIASIMILTLTSTFIVSVSIQNTNILKERILEEDVNRAICNIINEFKYNMSKEEIEDVMSNDKIGFKYDEYFSKKLMNTSVEELEQGNDIVISKTGEDNIGIKLKIVTNIKTNKNEVNLQKEFTKSWWMDET